MVDNNKKISAASRLRNETDAMYYTHKPITS